MKVIILHHLEPCWEHGLNKAGTSFEQLSERVIEHLQDNQYDRVILTRFEDGRLSDEHHMVGLAEFIDQVHDYAYGWDKEMVEQNCFPDDQEWVEGGSHSEIVLIDNWMKELENCDVHLCGAFDGECIEDMEIALSGANVQFSRIESLIV